MIGLIVFSILFIYFVFSVVVVVLIRKNLIKRNFSNLKRRVFLFFVVLILYLIPFWDLVPTIISHKYYCSSKSGFFVYKSVEDWSKLNPGALDVLQPYDESVPIAVPAGYARKMNDRFGRYIVKADAGFLSIKKMEMKFVDLRTNEVLARKVDFSSGFGRFGVSGEGAWKFWLYSSSCLSRDEALVQVESIEDFYKSFKAKGD